MQKSNDSEMFSKEEIEAFMLERDGLAEKYNNGYFTYYDYELQGAEEFFLKEIALSKMLAEKEPDIYAVYPLIDYDNAAQFYIHQDNYQKGEEYYLKAVEYGEMLLKENFEKYGEDVANTYNNVTNLYIHLRNPEKADEYQHKAAQIRETLSI